MQGCRETKEQTTKMLKHKQQIYVKTKEVYIQIFKIANGGKWPRRSRAPFKQTQQPNNWFLDIMIVIKDAQIASANDQSPHPQNIKLSRSYLYWEHVIIKKCLPNSLKGHKFLFSLLLFWSHCY